MSGLFAGTPLERPVTCEVCGEVLDACRCPRGGDGSVLLPRHQTAILRMEERRGKPVTIIAGLDRVATDLGDLARDLRKSCATGGTMGDDEIELQGEHRAAVAKLLRERGYKVKGA